jgi:hypothetical protein
MRVFNSSATTANAMTKNGKHETEKHARELIKEMRSELEAGGLKALVGPRMMFSELADWYKENYVKDAEYVDG